MTAWLPFLIIVYLMLGITIIPLAKKSPKYFGPAKELMEFIVVFTSSGGGVGFLVALAFIFLWPIALMVSMFLPSLTLEAKALAGAETDQKIAPELIGSIACCLTDLKPSGLIDVGGSSYDATSLKDFLAEGSRVKIVKKQGFNYVVEKIGSNPANE